MKNHAKELILYTVPIYLVYLEKIYKIENSSALFI